MNVDFENFLAWAKDRFGQENIKVRHTNNGDEILTHSFYAHRKNIEDWTFNLWMNPSGGKSKHPEKGSFRCWKTDTMGSLVKLVADFDHISYDDAEELVCGTTSLRNLEKKVHDFFGNKPECPVMPPESPEFVSLPDFTYLIDQMAETHYTRNKAVSYLSKRKISTQGLYVCVHGDYKDRIIIPYFDSEGLLVWYNSRAMNDKKNTLKYMKCKATKNVTQEDVLFMTKWVKNGKVYITEGEFDALSLKQCGFTGCAIGGKYLSETQIELLRPYLPVLAFDTDKEKFQKNAGLQALITIGKQLLEKGFQEIYYVRPPKAYKDWNNLLIAKDVSVLKKYIEECEKLFTSDTPAILLSHCI